MKTPGFAGHTHIISLSAQQKKPAWESLKEADKPELEAGLKSSCILLCPLADKDHKRSFCAWLAWGQVRWTGFWPSLKPLSFWALIKMSCLKRPKEASWLQWSKKALYFRSQAWRLDDRQPQNAFRLRRRRIAHALSVRIFSWTPIRASVTGVKSVCSGIK